MSDHEHEQSGETPLAREVDRALDGVLRRAQAALVWERLWPPLAALINLALLFAAVSFAGLWIALPPLLRGAGLLVFLAAGIFVLAPLRHLRWPGLDAARRRLDRQSGLSHRPVTAMTDRLAAAAHDPLTHALWQRHRARAQAVVGRVKAGWPRSHLARFDPFALRAAVIALALVAFVAAGPERGARLASAFDLSGAVPASHVRIDAWISPPAYTRRAPVLLTGAQIGGQTDVFTVPAGSTLVIRANAGGIAVASEGAIADAKPSSEPVPAGLAERRFLIAGDSRLSVRAPARRAPWQFRVIADAPPTISLLKRPQAQARGSLLLAYALEDDYGVKDARAEFMPVDEQSAGAGTKPRALFAPPQIALVLPAGGARQGKAQTIKDLTDHPFAGTRMAMVLVARDDAGNEGRSTPEELILPRRPFSNPLARALIDLRTRLARDANARVLIADAIDVLLLAPDVFTPKAGTYLGLTNIAQMLSHADSDDQLREIVASMWALALFIEDGNLTDVEKELRAAQEALRQALERGAGADEIKRLMDHLRAAIDKYLRQALEQALRNQQAQSPIDQNTRTLSDRDLRAMLDRLERAFRGGDRDGARQLLEQLQAMLENLRVARPGEGREGQSLMNELADILRKQQRLRDRTYQQGQNGGDAPRGQNFGGLRQDQEALRKRLGQLLDQLQKRGFVPPKGGGEGAPSAPRGENGQDETADGGAALGDAGRAMGEAQGRLGEGNSPGAVDAQGRAIEQLRRGARGLARALQGQPGEGENGEGQQGRGEGESRQAGDSPQTDPLGRPYRGRDYGNDTGVKIPGEIDIQRARRILDELRRRFSQPGRPQLELDYLERLLQDY